MKQEDYFFIGLIIGMSAFLILLSAMSKHAKQEQNHLSQEQVSKVYQEHPEELTLELLFKEENCFKDVALRFYLGDNYDYYFVGSDPGIQENVDKAVKNFCKQTSHLFYALCDDMESNDHYDAKAYTVLLNIVYRQMEYVKRYSSGLQKSTEELFRQEEERLSSLPGSYWKTKSLETIQHMKGH